MSGENAYELIDHEEFAQQVIHHIYSNYDAFILMLTKSQGSKYEHSVNMIVDTIEQNYLTLSETIGAHFGAKVNRYMLNWLVFIIVDSIIHLINHERDEKKAVQKQHGNQQQNKAQRDGSAHEAKSVLLKQAFDALHFHPSLRL